MLMLELDHQPWYFSALQGQIQVLDSIGQMSNAQKSTKTEKAQNFLKCINFDFQEKFHF